MYPAAFDYYRPETIAEALELLESHADTHVEVLAGGHSLIPTMKSGLASPDVLVDIGQIEEIGGIAVTEDTLRIGARTTYATIAGSGDVQETAPVIAEAAGAIGDIQVRNRGTVGGNIAHADPASDLPAAVLAANARITARGPDGTRQIPVDEFFEGMYATALDPPELVTHIAIPRLRGTHVGVYRKRPSPSSGYAIVGVAVVLRIQDGSITDARVAANGVVDRAVRLPGVEEAVMGADVTAINHEEAATRAMDDIDPIMLMDDLQSSGEFRAHLLEVYTHRALAKALDRVPKGGTQTV